MTGNLRYKFKFTLTFRSLPYSGPYKSALIAALLLYCAQGAAIEECRNKKHIFFIAAFLLRRSFTNLAYIDRHKRKTTTTKKLFCLFYCGRRSCLPNWLPKHGRKHRRSSRFVAAIEVSLYDPFLCKL